MITIIDIGIGNIGSVTRALKFLKCKYIVTDKKEDIENSTKLLFPGVGSFAEASRKLEASGLKEIIEHQVLVKQIPILGICLGMQLFAKIGFEGGIFPGFGFIDAEVKLIEAKKQNLRLPHMGWNNLSSSNLKLLDGTTANACFYFVHSYEMKLNENISHLTTEYGTDIVAMIEKDNIYATQFHPEKSQEQGLKIMKNFIELQSIC
ncbi:MAG: imidazole glycerol phosphate synthase subunit HisH [Bacteriovorax sp.]|nr:imidazole glycerol phosphate synthase subunit HisH [Bacteriovorax sp.]